MKCKVIRAYGPYCVGAIIEPPGVFRDELRRRGLIEPIVEEKPVVERAVRLTEAALADRPSRRRRK